MDEREEKGGERTTRRETLKAQTSFNGGLTEKIVFAQTRDLYEKAPPLKGKTFLSFFFQNLIQQI